MARVDADDIKVSLLARMAQGEWSDGRRLPAERDLASEYGAARNTVRKALDAIGAEGKVVRNVGHGTFLAQEAAEFGEIMKNVTGVSPADLMAVRMIVEPQAAAMAATSASTTDLDLIAEAHACAASETETTMFEHWDAVFHQRIFAAARNDLLLSLHDILRVVRNRNPWIELKRKTFSENRRLDYCTQHSEIVTALQRRDAEGAAAAMRDHMDVIHVNLFGRR
jgi:DNA-binding FadR family transcriptional regulator